MKGKVVISEQGAEYLRSGWNKMFKNNLVSFQNVFEGCLADIETPCGEYLASGFYSGISHVCVRVLTRRPDEKIDEDFFRKRISFALDYRMVSMRENFDNCRLVYGEADYLPGLTVDRYNDILVCQILCQGMEIRKDMIYRILTDEMSRRGQTVSAIYERNDLPARQKEGLPLYKGFYGDVRLPGETVISENGLKLYVDFAEGQKTGYFLDQKANRYKIRKMSAGLRVLDCFCHTGGFGLNAALGKAKETVCVDISPSALKEAKRNALLNGLEDRVEFVCADVFDYLDALEKGRFDMIILDPPAFTKSRRTVMAAYNGYKRINLAALKALNPGGYLVSCSCSRYMEKENFERMLKEASEQAGVSLRQVLFAAQNCDHPVLWDAQDSFYLKFYIFQLMDQ